MFLKSFRPVIFLFSAAFIFFGLSSHASAATWYVSKTAVNGWGACSDTTDNGYGQSTAKPWCDMSLVDFYQRFGGAVGSPIQEGDTIRINDGTYASNDSGLNDDQNYFIFYHRLNLTAENSGQVTLKPKHGVAPASAYYIFQFYNVPSGGDNSVTISGINFVGDGTATGLSLGVNAANSANIDFHITNCTFTNLTQSGIGGAGKINFYSTNNNITVIGTSDAHAIGGVLLSPMDGGFTIDGGTINVSGIYQGYFTGGIGVTADTGYTPQSGSYIKNTTISVTMDDSLSDLSSGIYVRGYPAPIIDKNNVTFSGKAGSNIAVSSNAAGADSPIISNNTLTFSEHTGAMGYLIGVGTAADDSTLNFHTNNPVIYNNVMAYGGATPALHGIYVGFQSGGEVYNNTISNTVNGIISKGQTQQGANFHDNIVKNSAYGWQSKGDNSSTPVNVENNIFYGWTAVGLFFADGDTSTGPENNTVSGNKLYATTNDPMFLYGNNKANTLVFQNNNYYTTGTTNQSWQLAGGGTTYSSLSAWQAAKEATATANSFSASSTYNAANLSSPTISYNAATIDAGTATSRTVDVLGNPFYGTQDIGAYEYQPPHDLTLGTPDEIDIGAGARIYANGKFRDLGTTNSSTASLKITPSGGSFTAYNATDTRPAWLDVTNVANWAAGHKTWTESNAQTSNMITDHTVGDLDPNSHYIMSVSGALTSTITGVNGTICSTVNSNRVCTSNGSGVMSFRYSGGYSTHTFDMQEASSDATVISSTYIVNSTLNTITGIPYATSVGTFTSNLTAASGATFVVYESDGTTPRTGSVSTGDKVIVTAEDGVITKTYTLTVAANTVAAGHITGGANPDGRGGGPDPSPQPPKLSGNQQSLLNKTLSQALGNKYSYKVKQYWTTKFVSFNMSVDKLVRSMKTEFARLIKAKLKKVAIESVQPIAIPTTIIKPTTRKISVKKPTLSSNNVVSPAVIIFSSTPTPLPTITPIPITATVTPPLTTTPKPTFFGRVANIFHSIFWFL